MSRGVLTRSVENAARLGFHPNRMRSVQITVIPDVSCSFGAKPL
jgi:hypothetical protein